MTGVPNRRYVFEALERSFKEIEQNKKEHFSIVIFDIDHFKNVNDTFGHSAGDEIIKKVSYVESEQIRSPKIFGRIGGEEFLAIIYNSTETYISEICEKIRILIEKEITSVNQNDISVTVSGGASITNESLNISDLVNKADERLYLAKKNGRNRFYLNDG